jgi:hypothetical protein
MMCQFSCVFGNLRVKKKQVIEPKSKKNAKLSMHVHRVLALNSYKIFMVKKRSAVLRSKFHYQKTLRDCVLQLI